MTATTNPPVPPLVPVATRVLPEFRQRLDAAIERRVILGDTVPGKNGPRPFDLSSGIREALHLWLRVQEGKLTVLPASTVAAAAALENGTPGTARRRDPATSRKAAADVAPRIGSQRRRVLEQFARAGEEGLTTDELLAILERAHLFMHLFTDPDDRPSEPPPANGVARRVTDLLDRGALEPATLAGTSTPVTRPTRRGRAAQVWTITPKGRSWLA
jgi:hypothetical protein